MKKILSVIMLLTVLVMLAPAALADGTPTVTVSQETAAPGEEVTVTVSLENNPGIMACVMGLSYDTGALELVSTEHTGLSGTWMIGENAVWVGSSDSTYDGDILYLTFRVKEGANGNAEVTASCGDGAFANSAEESVAFSVVSGGVTVSGGTESEPEKEPEETKKPTETTETTGTTNTAETTNTTGTAAAAEDTDSDEELLESLHDTMLEMTDGEELPSLAVTLDETTDGEESVEEEPAETPEIEHEAVQLSEEEEEKGVDVMLLAIIALGVLLVVLVVLIVVVKKRG